VNEQTNFCDKAEKARVYNGIEQNICRINEIVREIVVKKPILSVDVNLGEGLN
jgi:hypothetical protein